MEIKQIIPNLNKPVYYNGTEYRLTGSTIRRDKQGQLYYQSELLDKNLSSVIIVSLDDVEGERKWQVLNLSQKEKKKRL